MREGTVRANGLEFAYREEGDGPLVLLLHGFPDIASTWEHVMPDLAASGFRAVAVNTRGYPPTDVPGEGAYFDSGTLATDARELIRALGDDPAFVVGHDWGAATTYYLCAAFPEAVRRAVTMAIPHPLAIGRTLLSPQVVHRAFHWWFFQLPDTPEIAIRESDYGWIDYLWKIWSPGHEDTAHVSRVKDALREPGALEASLAYYRAMWNAERQDPATAPVREALLQPIKVPMMTILGTRDLRVGDPDSLKEYFAGEFELATVEAAGHFLQRERPAEVAQLILRWLHA